MPITGLPGDAVFEHHHAPHCIRPLDVGHVETNHHPGNDLQIQAVLKIEEDLVGPVSRRKPGPTPGLPVHFWHWTRPVEPAAVSPPGGEPGAAPSSRPSPRSPLPGEAGPRSPRGGGPPGAGRRCPPLRAPGSTGSRRRIGAPRRLRWRPRRSARFHYPRSSPRRIRRATPDAISPSLAKASTSLIPSLARGEPVAPGRWSPAHGPRPAAWPPPRNEVPGRPVAFVPPPHPSAVPSHPPGSEESPESFLRRTPGSGGPRRARGSGRCGSPGRGDPGPPAGRS